MNRNSSPGKDGFTSHFYLKCWDIICDDVMAFVLDFFKGAYIPKDIGVSTLVLIPKISTPEHMGDYRPISVVNFSAKIISKILAARLASLLPKLMDEEHAGFIQGRNISQHIVLD